jgi:hypothetical protein
VFRLGASVLCAADGKVWRQAGELGGQSNLAIGSAALIVPRLDGAKVDEKRGQLDRDEMKEGAKQVVCAAKLAICVLWQLDMSLEFLPEQEARLQF